MRAPICQRRADAPRDPAPGRGRQRGPGVARVGPAFGSGVGRVLARCIGRRCRRRAGRPAWCSFRYRRCARAAADAGPAPCLSGARADSAAKLLHLPGRGWPWPCARAACSAGSSDSVSRRCRPSECDSGLEPHSSTCASFRHCALRAASSLPWSHIRAAACMPGCGCGCSRGQAVHHHHLHAIRAGGEAGSSAAAGRGRMPAVVASAFRLMPV